MKQFCLVLTFALTALSLGSSSLCAAETINDKSHHFKLAVPDGFVPVAKNELPPGYSYFWVCQEPFPANTQLLLSIQEATLPLQQSLPTKKGSRKKPDPSVLKVDWKSFSLPVAEVPERVDGVNYINLNVNIPLKDQYIMVSMSGPENRKLRMHWLLQEVVNALKGETNWLTPEEKELASDDSYISPWTLPIILGGTFLIFTIFRNIKRRKEKRSISDNLPPSDSPISPPPTPEMKKPSNIYSSFDE